MYSVFITDDEPWGIIGLKKLIDWGEEGFYIIGEANDGISAWERINKLHPDVLLCDIKMPGMSGIELAQKVRDLELNLEVVFISGYSEFEFAKSAILLGITDYLIKQIDPNELRACLKRLRLKLDQKSGIQSGDDQEVRFISDKVLVNEIIEYIEQNYDKPITLSDISKKYSYSQGYLSSIIKKKTGKSFVEHFTECRIHKAQELLRTTNCSIEEIAKQIGFSDYFYFIKVYKKATGVSPSVYRKQL